MEMVIEGKQAPPLFWKLWTIFAIVMFIGAVFDVNPFSLLKDEEGISKFPATPGINYYNLLRFIVCGLAIYGLYLARKTLGVSSNNSQLGMAIVMTRIKKGIDYNPSPTWINILFSWWFIFLIQALLFNPIIPLHMSREHWLIMDLIAIAFLISSFFLFHSLKLIKLCDHCGTTLKKGYYRNYERSAGGSFIGDELCIGCVTEMRRLGSIEVDPKEPWIVEDNE